MIVPRRFIVSIDSKNGVAFGTTSTINHMRVRLCFDGDMQLLIAIFYLIITEPECNMACFLFYSGTDRLRQLLHQTGDVILPNHTSAGSCVQDGQSIGLEPT